MEDKFLVKMELALNANKIKGQNAFLEEMKCNMINVTVFLINGVKLKGVITHYDDDCVLLSRDENIQLIYKNAISTMMPYVEKF